MAHSVLIGVIAVLQMLVLIGRFCTVQACSHTINRTSDAIYSPGYPDMQDGLVTCSWNIIGDEHHILLFKITDMYIPSLNVTNCTQNYIHFSSPDKRYCGSLIDGMPVVYTSSSAFLSLKYYNSGIPRPGKGFHIDFFKVPKALLTSTPCAEDYFFCRSDQYCIRRAWLENGINECSDGSDEVVPTQVADISLTEVLTTMRPKFIPCSRTFTALSGYFHTPNYPHIYAHESSCDWLIEVRKDQKVQLYFMSFRLSSRDKISIYDGIKMEENKIGVYTQHSRPDYLIQSTRNRLFVEFTSPSIAAGFGFNATYQVKGFCKSDGWFDCGYGEDLCYYKNLQCDGIWHCEKHGGDERNCGQCHPDRFQCSPTSPKCYSEADRCNGQHYCAGYEDEKECTPEKCGPLNGTFLCHNKRCIVESWTCDGTNDCGDNSDEQHCSGVASRRVITTAVVGAILCALLLVIALGCTCRLHAMRMRDIMGQSYVSPLTRVEQEIWETRSAPPLYDEAMRQSRPYDEMLVIIEQALRSRSGSDHSENGVTSDEELLVDGNEAPNPATQLVGMNDDEMLDLEESDSNDNASSPSAEDSGSIGASNVEITLSAGATAQWRRSQGGATISNGTKIRKNVTLALKENSGHDNHTEEPSKALPANNAVSVSNTDEVELSVGTGTDYKVPQAASAIEQNVITNNTCDNDINLDSFYVSSGEHQQPTVCLSEQSQDSLNDESQVLSGSLNQKCSLIDILEKEGASISAASISVQHISSVSENTVGSFAGKPSNPYEIHGVNSDQENQVDLMEGNDFENPVDDTVPLL